MAPDTSAGVAVDMKLDESAVPECEDEDEFEEDVPVICVA